MSNHSKSCDDLFLQGVRKVLWDHWDPIGLNDNPLLSDEYDAYVPRVAAILMAPNAGRHLNAYLRMIETEQMGVGRQSDSAAKIHFVVEKLFELKTSMPCGDS